ncbi:MAG: hypothetical protein ACRDFC_03435 [Ignavibacteria bacterium]
MKKIIIEEIKSLLPDYISGGLGQSDAAKVKEALESSPELKNLYLEMSKTFEFLNTVKLEEPSPGYWNSMLPRIHEKIEQRKGKMFKNPFEVIWKILAPVAAVVLIFMIYKIVSAPSPEITKDQNKVITDTLSKDKIENKKPEIIKDENKLTKVEKDKKIKRYKTKTYYYKEKPIENNQKSFELNLDKQIAKEENNVSREEEIASLEFSLESEFDDIETMYEESEKEFNKLNDNEQSEVLNKIRDFNL